MQTFQTLRNVNACELREGDWPVSVAGYRPITRVVDRPRKRTVALTIDGQRYEMPHHKVIGRVRRPLNAPEPLRRFDPSATQVR